MAFMGRLAGITRADEKLLRKLYTGRIKPVPEYSIAVWKQPLYQNKVSPELRYVNYKW